ncbi:hypothetical protein SAMN05444396_104296 [Flavobacterium segetis]|uniref:CarboxypepD_reg-like domain-containing protein n=2 Tax=Flavobacterium segetis TaxID=271157 RepID=A0A1M5H0Z6_9FLAO|nr:hypothetical protein SAMN05444396_104296 [Flavobacterium segetis]
MEGIWILLPGSNILFSKMTRLFSLFLLVYAMQVSAQDLPRDQLSGKVVADFTGLDTVYILNERTKAVSTANMMGYFNILAKEYDILVFSGFQIIETKIIVTKKDLEQQNLVVQLKQEINQLDEVIVNGGINAVSLGIIPKGQKSYTAAERKLYTATDLNASANVGTMMGGSASLDPLMNWISGRTKMLKKDLEVEKKEGYLKKIENIFPLEYITTKLQIPVIYVKGFKYFIVENKEFIKILESNNTALATFFIGDLAIQYREIIASEN